MQKEFVDIAPIESYTYRSIKEIDKRDWERLQKDYKNIYLSYDYLVALEKAMNYKMDFAYSVSYDTYKKPVLIAYFQLVHFTTNKKECPKVLHQKKPHNVSINLLVCGNVYSNGANGFITDSSIPSERAIKELTKITKDIKNRLTEQKISIILFKEFSKESTFDHNGFEKQHYSGFMADVNMALKIHKNWRKFDDYLFSMTTKYRTRIKSIYRKSSPLTIKSLNAEEIKKYEKELKYLLENVSKKAEYNYGVIAVSSFILFKEKLKNNFILKALFLDSKMVGFSTSFVNNNLLEANYVGLDYELNLEYSIYQRLLCDYVEQAIDRNMSELHFGRTSELVKSALGAKPINMKLYAKHKNVISNFLLKPIFHFITPNNFDLRKPFKASFDY